MGNGALAIGPKLPRPSSTLPKGECRDVRHDGGDRGSSEQTKSEHRQSAVLTPTRHFVPNVPRRSRMLPFSCLRLSSSWCFSMLAQRRRNSVGVTWSRATTASPHCPSVSGTKLGYSGALRNITPERRHHRGLRNGRARQDGCPPQRRPAYRDTSESGRQTGPAAHPWERAQIARPGRTGAKADPSTAITAARGPQASLLLRHAF